jgi:hypothetical protein
MADFSAKKRNRLAGRRYGHQSLPDGRYTYANGPIAAE